jgi:hypothetical protein
MRRIRPTASEIELDLGVTSSAARTASQTRKEVHGAADFPGEPARLNGFAAGDRRQIVGLEFVHRYRAQYIDSIVRKIGPALG